MGRTPVSVGIDGTDQLLDESWFVKLLPLNGLFYEGSNYCKIVAKTSSVGCMYINIVLSSSG